MKRTLISILWVLFIAAATAQTSMTTETAVSPSPVNIGLDEINSMYTPPAVFKTSLKSGAVNSCDIVVSYVNFPAEAKAAFEYAISIWEKCISSDVQINLIAKWEELPHNELAHGCPSLFFRNFKDTPINNVFYPIALAEKLGAKEYNSSEEADITCSFNKSQDWYFGTDGNTPVTKYDFVTAVLHEIGHGLGISGFFASENGMGRYNNSSNSPSIYDYFVFNSKNQQISDKSLFPTPSAELTYQLTSNSLVFRASDENQDLDKIDIYAPNKWVNGLSIYHLQKENLSGESSELMSAHAYKGEAIHNPGARTLYVLSELGWDVNTNILNEEMAKSAHKNDVTNGENLNIYPNPCTNSLTFDCENANIESSVDIVITDLMGATVYREKMNDIKFNPKLKIDLTSVRPGIYLASVTDSNLKTITTKRIIKN